MARRWGNLLTEHEAVNVEIRRRNTLDFLCKFGKYNRVWLQEIADKYKERGLYGITPFSLADYYDRAEDKEVALFSALLMSDNDNVLLQIEDMRGVIGDHPWRWFVSRGFIELGMGDTQNRRLDGNARLSFWEIAHMLDVLWRFWRDEGGGFLCDSFLMAARSRQCGYYEILSTMLCNCGVGSFLYKLRLLLIHLTASDGFGKSLWTSDGHGLRSPVRNDIAAFLRLWFPDYRFCGMTFDSAVDALGLRNAVDFYYSFLGFERMRRANGEETGRYCRTYQTKYNNRTKDKLWRLRDMQPPIIFDNNDET